MPGTPCRTSRLLALLALVACGGDAPTVVDDQGTPAPGVRVTISRQGLGSTIARLTPVDTPIEIVVRDASGSRMRGVTVRFDGSTGWVAPAVAGVTAATARYAMPGQRDLDTDSSGTLRIFWYPGGEAVQTLRARAAAFNGRDSVRLSGIGAVTTLTDTIVVASGLTAACVLRNGRVGCLGHGAPPESPDSATAPGAAPAALGALRWLTFEAPVVRMHAHDRGVCALLANGRAACWSDVGPADGTVASLDAVPALRDLRGGVGLARDGEVGEIGPVEQSGPPWYRTGWRSFARDTSIVRLATHERTDIVCAMTRDDVLRCGSIYRFPQANPYVLATMVDARTGQPVRAREAVVSGDVYQHTSIEWIGTDDAPYGYLSFSRIITFGGSVPAVAPAPPYPIEATRRSTWPDNLRRPDGTHGCVALLDSTCAGGPWRSYSIAGTSYNARRTCAVRDVAVCITRRFSPNGPPIGSFTRTDTLRVRS